MPRTFCVVGPTGIGKSELAADVAVRLGAEIVNADAFQIYRGFDVLSGKPDRRTLRKVPHHLIGTVPVSEEMSAAKYRTLALPVIDVVRSRGKVPLIVGGSGLYIKAVTHGLDETPAGDAELREQLDTLTTAELGARLIKIDPSSSKTVDMKNRRRVMRALEIALISGRPASEQRTRWSAGDCGNQESGIGFQPMVLDSSAGSRCHEIQTSSDFSGVFVFRDRGELYQRINKRVESMLDHGAIDEVREAGKLSLTVEQMIGVKDIRKYLAGEISRAQCLANIQQLTRRYAKRQLTWFRHQTNFESLNLSLLSHNEAVLRVLPRAIAAPACGE